MATTKKKTVKKSAKRSKPSVDEIVAEIGTRFRTFGGKTEKPKSVSNPLDAWMATSPLTFALGVDVRQVVEFVLSKAKR